MSSPVQLSDLPAASVADDADLALIRKDNTTDYKTTVAILRKINIAGLTAIPTPAQPTDKMMISQTGTVYRIDFGSVGFTQGTKMWFYQNSEPVSPAYWQIVPNTGDTLLGVKGGGTYSTGGVTAGTWQQVDHTLTVDEIPAHTHTVACYFAITNFFQNTGKSAVGGGNASSNATSSSVGGGQGHNHGNAWRPLASVGLICQKST